MDNEEGIKLWKSFGRPDPDLEMFVKYSSTLRDRTFFHNLAHIAGETIRIFVKIFSEMYLWITTSPLLCILEVVRIQTGFALAEVCVHCSCFTA